MKIRSALPITFIALLFVIMNGCLTLPEDGEEEYGSYQDDPFGTQDEAFTVTIYEHANFRGREESYILGPDQRHVLVEFVGWGLNDRLSSVRCGERVGVVLFRDRDFRGPVAVYDRSTDRVDSDINDWASSIIVFELDAGGPLGVWLGHGGRDGNVLDVNGFHGTAYFYPMPESLNYREGKMDLLRGFNDLAEWVVLGPVDPRDYRETRYRERGSGYRRYDSGRRRSLMDIEIDLYEHSDFRGQSLSLPERSRSGYYFELKDYNFSRIASSIIMVEYSSRRRW